MHEMINDIFLGLSWDGSDLGTKITSIFIIGFFSILAICAVAEGIVDRDWVRGFACFILPFILIVFAKQTMSNIDIVLYPAFLLLVVMLIVLYLSFSSSLIKEITKEITKESGSGVCKLSAIFAYSISYIVLLISLHQGQWVRYAHDKMMEINAGKISYKWENANLNKREYIVYRLINDSDSLVKMQVSNISYLKPFKVLRENNLKYTTMRWNHNPHVGNQSVHILCHIKSGVSEQTQDVVMTIDTYSHIVKNMNDIQTKNTSDTSKQVGSKDDFEIIKKAITE